MDLEAANLVAADGMGAEQLRRRGGRACVAAAAAQRVRACVRSRASESASACVRECLGAAASGLGLGLLCLFIYFIN